MATEDRWHDFVKEKPSEDMEGRNFIVSNGHYEKIATWCGYWENEPFMGDRLCDEVVRWKGYLTPEEEKANEATRTELKSYSVVATSETENYINGEINLAFEAYDADEVDALLAEKDAAIADLKKQLHDLCAQSMDVSGKTIDKVSELMAENERLQKEISDITDGFCDSTHTHIKELRATRRSLWIARAERAIEKIAWFKLWNASISTMNPEDGARQEYDKWKKSLGKFLKKAEEYK